MNVKIIKRAERVKITGQIPVAVGQTKNDDAQITMATTIKSWIVDLRQKHENERLEVKALFRNKGDYYCSEEPIISAKQTNL